MNEDIDTGIASAKAAVNVHTAKDGSYIKFFSTPGAFTTFVTDKLLTDNDKTVGQRNIEWLHEKLDEWIAENLK